MTRYPELWQALGAPFDDHEVKRFAVKGRQLSYVTARTVMNRLDSVVGPESWSDSYSETKDGLKCKLTILLPDGSTVSKEDGGAPAGMDDADNDEKSAFSSAFKRAAVKFGIARYLYRDGTPNFALPPAAAAPAAVAALPNPNGKPTHEWPGKGPGSAGVSAGAQEAMERAKGEAAARRPVPSRHRITAAQVRMILQMAEARGVTDDQLAMALDRYYHAASLQNLDRVEANELIQRLRDSKRTAAITPSDN
jgi:Rad52/22 family double-strand break repair protein